MTHERMPPAGPAWRPPAAPPSPESERVFVACRCGTDMSFAWPAERDDVRCFACGLRFPRPAHLPAARRLPPWVAAPPRRLPGRGALLVLFLTALAAGLLGAALALLVAT